MYEARKICNFILARYDAHKFELTNLRLNKLLYFIHGYSFNQRAAGLVRNHFEAWKLGPVVRPVYVAFKDYGENEITSLATYLEYSSGENRVVPYDDIASEDADIIASTFEAYAQYSTNVLVAMSHEPGGPWDATFRAWSANQRLSPRIPNQLIRSHFVGDKMKKDYSAHAAPRHPAASRAPDQIARASRAARARSSIPSSARTTRRRARDRGAAQDQPREICRARSRRRAKESYDQRDDRRDAEQRRRIAERPRQRMGKGEREMLPAGIRAVDVGALDPAGRWLQQQCERAERDRDDLDGGL